MWAAILKLLAAILSLFRGKGYRANLEVRSEASIDAERKRLDRLAARITGIKAELHETVIKIVAAKRRGDMRSVDALDDKRERLLNQLHQAQRDYIDARGYSPDGRRISPV